MQVKPMIRKPITSSCTAISRSILLESGTILLESQIRQPGNFRSCLLNEPVDVIECTDPGRVHECLGRIDEELRRGNYVAGFISYEAGLALNPHQSPRLSDGFPLVWMAIYSKAWITDAPLILPGPSNRMSDTDPKLDLDREGYIKSVERILGLIREGDTYQVNLTGRLRFQYPQSGLDMYLRLRQSHPVPFGALMNCGPFSLVSQSPELFLKKTRNILETRPMKGTAARGADIQGDREKEKDLRQSGKDRAENLMIGDLMRNDLGKIACPGSVEVFDPFRIEKYRSVLQMTTGIRCRVPDDLTVKQILSSTFPPGSITGAPKVRTMQIIGDLEKNPRKVYTGAMGIFYPDGDFVLSVAIRTIIMNRDGTCEMGVGSGIVADSSPEKEYNETLLKSHFLKSPETETVCLLETIRLNTRGELEYLPEHLERMERSARVLQYPFSTGQANDALETHMDPVPEGPAIVRLLLDLRGDYRVQVRPLEDLNPARLKRIRLSSRKTERSNELLSHKTTHRHLYDEELEKARTEGYVESLFENTDGQITEGAFTNIFLLMPDGWKTPPVSSGLLPGIWRGKFLKENSAVEVPLSRVDLSGASRVIVGNCVRGAIEVDEVVDPEGRLIFKEGNR